MADDNKKVNATITMVFKSGAVMYHLVNGDATSRYNIAVTPTEHEDDRDARLAEAKHARWRESIRFVFIDIIVKMAVFGAIISGLAWSATILADKNSTSEAKNVADSSIKLILGSITGFAVGKCGDVPSYKRRCNCG